MRRFSRCILLGTVLLVCALAPAAAQTVSVAYAEGEIEVQRGSKWEDVLVGDTLRARARIRLGDSGYVELSRGRDTVRLTRPGSYEISSLFETVERNQRAGLGAMIRSRVRSLFGGDEREDEPAVAGVRGDETESGELMWAGGEDPAELIDRGIELLAAGNYGEARYRFEEARDFAETDAQATRAAFYLAYTDYTQGNVREAVSAFAELDMAPQARDYGTYALAYGQALVETFAYEEAVEWLESYLEGSEPEPAPADRQAALVLLGVAHEGAGDTASARRALEEAVALRPESDEARVAKDVLAGL